MASGRSARVAVISVGTNSCRLLIAQRADGELKPEHHETRGTRLGEGVNQRHRLDAAAIDRTLAAVHEYAQLSDGVGHVFGIGTSALRDAANAQDFCMRFREAAGARLEILAGEEEARCSFAGALAGLRAAGRSVPAAATVIDVGGGSTEFATRSREGDEPAVASLQIGAVRLTERYLRSDPPSHAEVAQCRTAIRSALNTLASDVAPREFVVAVGGTATTAARMLQLMEDGGSGVAEIPGADLQGLLKATISLRVDDRKRLRSLPPQRADIFPGGVMILEEATSAAGAASLVVCESDLLLGYLERHDRA